jgi:SSS family solute:Na+ symporter
MVADFLAPGLLGIVVAGVLAGAVSTYDSIGSALAAVFTRDIYGRFFNPNASDATMLRMSRWSTIFFIAISFGYIPFFGDGMVAFYLRLTSVAVMPLFAVYLMGALTRVHKGSGAWGLGAGVLYGLTSFAGEAWDWNLPFWWTNTWWSYLWSVLVPAAAMFAYSLVQGWEPAVVEERPHEPPRPLYAHPVAWATLFFTIIGSLVFWLW